jgi:hypothetical protein
VFFKFCKFFSAFFSFGKKIPAQNFLFGLLTLWDEKNKGNFDQQEKENFFFHTFPF